MQSETQSSIKDLIWETVINRVIVFENVKATPFTPKLFYSLYIFLLFRFWAQLNVILHEVIDDYSRVVLVGLKFSDKLINIFN